MLKFFYKRRGAIGGPVIDHQYMKILVHAEYRGDDPGNIFPFIVGGFND